jgi:alkylated DNA repair dioxygenase AlkB
LAAPINMIFKNRFDKGSAIGEKVSLLLMPRSIIVLEDNARYNWTHGIPVGKNYKIYGKSFPRKTRISLTFRKIIENI